MQEIWNEGFGQTPILSHKLPRYRLKYWRKKLKVRKAAKYSVSERYIYMIRLYLPVTLLPPIKLLVIG